MELIDQHTKSIMEGCKQRAKAAGLRFEDETLEYIVTNRDLLELSPKVMIPTLYDYWVHDVEVLREKGRYELYPGNPYETVINTRPAISFYNDNNPDWLNVMIFYHVLAHIDFFQNNIYFRHTWDDDFAGQALADKRLVAKTRAERGRWLDYVIEFARGMDNLVGYHRELSRLNRPNKKTNATRLDYYFDVFLQTVKKVKPNAYLKEIERYNQIVREHNTTAEEFFFSDLAKTHPEFEALYKKFLEKDTPQHLDLIEYILEHSAFLAKEQNSWIKPILQVVRNTSIFLQPQIRTKIMNEGWASYWHETLFLQDDRIKGHEVDFARVNAGVTSMPRVGLNPYALGMRLFYFIEEMADKGRFDYDFERLRDQRARASFDRSTGRGRQFIFEVRENYSDFTAINRFVDQDFVTRNKLFVAGQRLNEAKRVWEYYVKSRRAQDYRQMLFDTLYHPPHIHIRPDKGVDGTLYLFHHFEGKPLVTDFIANTLIGIEYLWGNPVHLETSEPVAQKAIPKPGTNGMTPSKVSWQRVVYTMNNRKLSKKKI